MTAEPLNNPIPLSFEGTNTDSTVTDVFSLNEANILPYPYANVIDDVQEMATEVTTKKSEPFKNVAATVLAVMSFAGGPMNMEDARANVDGYALNAELIKEGTTTALREWRSNPHPITRIGQRVLPWLNLGIGETIALIPQGIAQSEGASPVVSFGIGVLGALAVEAGFGVPAAMHNTEKRSAEEVAEATVTGFWLGGAMGIDNKRLPLSQAAGPITAYMLYGTALSGIAEYNNIAEQFVDNKSIVIPGLLAWGAMKKMYDFFGYKTFSDRSADKAVEIVRSDYAAVEARLTDDKLKRVKLPAILTGHVTRESMRPIRTKVQQVFGRNKPRTESGTHDYASHDIISMQ
jgi:hypothetical protein